MEESIKNVDETVMENSLVPDSIICGLGEVIFQPFGVTKPPEVLEKNDAMTMMSAEMLS